VERWMADITPNNEMFMSSDKILTLVDPTEHILEEYLKLVR
jgi:hypothetical protein|tara:strand:- start:575 stop:697 length:123 start_codon:yes stop_codon:yes gene_type:complete